MNLPHFLAEFTSGFRPLPHAPAGQGYDLLSTLTPEQVHQSFAANVTGEVAVDMRAPIIGETVIAGRRGIVAQFTGTLTTRGGGGSVTIAVEGYGVYDLETSIAAQSEMLTLATLRDGQRFELAMQAETSFN